MTNGAGHMKIGVPRKSRTDETGKNGETTG